MSVYIAQWTIDSNNSFRWISDNLSTFNTMCEVYCPMHNMNLILCSSLLILKYTPTYPTHTHTLAHSHIHTHTHTHTLPLTRTDRPLSRNHIISRMEKHLGDLYLLTGQLQQASAHYRSALPSLKSFKDWLWAGSVHEALSVTAIITKECEEVLGQKAHGTAIGGTGNIFKKVCSY